MRCDPTSTSTIQTDLSPRNPSQQRHILKDICLQYARSSNLTARIPPRISRQVHHLSLILPRYSLLMNSLRKIEPTENALGWRHDHSPRTPQLQDNAKYSCWHFCMILRLLNHGVQILFPNRPNPSDLPSSSVRHDGYNGMQAPSTFIRPYMGDA